MNTTNNTTNNVEKKDEPVVYTDAMLPELSQEDIETAESVHCKSWVLRKLESGRRLLQLERGDVSRPSSGGRKLPKVFCSRQHRFVALQYGYAKAHLRVCRSGLRD